MAYTDIEELALRIHSSQARVHIDEAIRCFRAGAYRSAIVQTWISVVQDIFEKVREVAVSGDAAATAYVNELDKIVAQHQIQSALSLERDCLTAARDTFDFITQNEFEDLDRLRVDRQRCAHPSLNRPQDVYSPPPELARLHIRSALEHLLTRPPTQSRASLQQIQSEIDGAHFPTDRSKAVVYIRSSVLARPKESLLRDFVNSILCSCINDGATTETHRLHRLVALAATQKIHPANTNALIQARLSKEVLRASDAALPRVFEVLFMVDDAWSMLSEAMRIRAATALQSDAFSTDAPSIFYSFSISDLKPIALAKLPSIDRDTLQLLVRDEAPREVFDEAVTRFIKSPSWSDARENFSSFIVPGIGLYPSDIVDRICHESIKNNQIYGINIFPRLIEQIEKSGKASPEALAALKSRPI